MRSRFWLFALLVAAVLAANLALVSARFAQTSEEALGSRLTVASGGLRTQIELVDLRSSPRIAAFSPELIEATKPEGSQQAARPDERALRAAAAALQPEPDLVVVATAHTAAVSRRGKAASLGEEPARLPLIRIALEGGASPQFVSFEGKLYRAAASRIPGNAAVVLTGTAIDDRFAAQLRSLVDADVSFLQQGAVVATTLAADDRAAISAWAKAPAGAAGFGALRIVLPGVGARFSEQLPLGAPRAATRAALVPLSQGVQGAVSVPAAPNLAWLARYQAFYAAGWALFILVSFIWGLAAGRAPRVQTSRSAPVPTPPRAREETAIRRVSQPSGAGGSAADSAVGATPQSGDAPWTDEPVSAPVRAKRRGHEPLDPELAAVPGKDDEPQLGDLPAAGADPIWSGDPFGPSARAGAGQEQEQGGPPAPLGAGWSNEAADGAAAPGGWGQADPGAAEPWPPPEPEAKPTPKPAGPAKPADEGEDPDEAHFRDTFEKFMALRAETGESAALSYDKFAAKLRQNREQLLSRGTARTVRFTVYKKDGRAAIKASAIR